MKTRPRLYGLMAEFETAEASAELPHTWLGRPAIAKWMPTRPIPSTDSRERLGEKQTRMPFVVLIGGLTGGARRLLHAVLVDGRRLPVQRRRPPAQQLARFHSGHF